MPSSGTPARFAAALACEARIGTIPSELKPFVQLRVPPEGVYLAAADAVRDLTARLEGSSADSPALKVLLDDIKNEDFTEFWSPEDKTLHEYMHQSGIAMSLVASSASTGNDTLSRVLFYLEFGRNLGDVPLLGPGKRRWLQIIGKKMQSSLHDLIVRRFDDAVLADIGAHLPPAATSNSSTCGRSNSSRQGESIMHRVMLRGRCARRPPSVGSFFPRTQAWRRDA